MEVRRRGRSLFLAGQHYRFPSPPQTAQCAEALRNLPEGVSTYQVDLIIKRYKGRKLV